jgi:hypothetical protein
MTAAQDRRNAARDEVTSQLEEPDRWAVSLFYEEVPVAIFSNLSEQASLGKAAELRMRYPTHDVQRYRRTVIWEAA